MNKYRMFVKKWFSGDMLELWVGGTLAVVASIAIGVLLQLS